MNTRPTVVDLFAGAGLFSHAFKEEGFHITKAIEYDRSAASTYAANLGNHIEVQDIRKVKAVGRCDVLVAGPPCQGFSTLGKCEENDERNFLSLEVVRWAKELNPEIVVIENVEPFIKSPIWQLTKKKFEGLGYNVESVVLNAFDFGVPQLRLRSFTFASRGKVINPSKLRSFSSSTVREAWKGLTRSPNGKNLHYSPTPSSLTLARMKLIPPEGDRWALIEKAPYLLPKSLTRLGRNATDVWGRLRWDQPCNTLRTASMHPSKGRYMHPEQHRVISLREAARLHSIPDSWQFLGSPTQIAKQIGNSVPPGLGRAVARAVRKSL